MQPLLIQPTFILDHPVPLSPPAPEFFRMRFLVDDGHNYPLFQPGWPLLIAIFYKLKSPGLAPGFAVASLVVGASRLAERLYGRLTSLLTGALLVACGFLMVVGGAFFAHAWAAALFVLALERLVVPPDAERDLPQDPAAALDALAAHPDRRDIRLVVAVLRDGRSCCLLRQREHDRDDRVAKGGQIAPGLVAALAATLL